MEDTKRIITRAVYGNKVQTFRNNIRISTNEGEKLTDVLGCTINGAKVTGASIEGEGEKGKKVRVHVKFDIHTWYRSGNDTKVVKVSAEQSDIIEIAKQGPESYSNEEVHVWMKEAPKCLDTTSRCKTEGNLLAVPVEYVLEAEIIGETELNVRVYNS